LPLSTLSPIILFAVGLPYGALLAWAARRFGATSSPTLPVALVTASLFGAAQEPFQRLIGGGRLDNRPALRSAFAITLFGAWVDLFESGFLLPVCSVLVAAVHVHWSGAKAWPRVAAVAVAMTVINEILVQLRVVHSFVPTLASHGFALLSLGIALIAIANLGMAAARREEVGEELARAEARFRTLVQNSSDVVTVVDRSGTFSYVSSASGRALDLRANDVRGRPATAIVHPDDRAEFSIHLARVIDGEATASRWEARMETGLGPMRWLEFSATNLLDDAIIAGVVMHLRDVTERREFQDQLAYAAAHDSLTGLNSRGEFLAAAATLLIQARPGCAVAVFYCDLDRFKVINDTLGHSAGDEVLLITAHRLRSALRPQALLGRMGGDEFAAMMPNVTEPGASAAIAARLKEAVLAPILLRDGQVVQVGVSVGHHLVDWSEADPDRALRRADRAMYEAKQAGRLGPPA
jgi:diguanylate cyclase (GGDEF)-like protein/PAS domain S-box-containing protein